MNTYFLDQKLSKYYVSSVQKNGVLYVLNPQQGFKNRKLSSQLIYDITYSTVKDSATMKFSYFDKRSFNINSISLLIDGKEVSMPTEKISVGSHKKKWEYRYASLFLYKELCTFFDQTNSPQIYLQTDKGVVKLGISNKQWRIISTITRRIFTLIHHNHL